jgi:hypothetical protein
MNNSNAQHEKEKSALEQLYSDVPMPSLLHFKIIEKMKNEGLINTPRPLLRASLTGILSALLIALALVALGFTIGKDRNATPMASKQKFVLLVHNDDVPPADPTQQFNEYSVWLKNLKTSRFADGESLDFHMAATLKNNEGKPSVEYIDSREDKKAVSGYFVFEADNKEEALKIAQTCPHLNYKGSLELREIFK